MNTSIELQGAWENVIKLIYELLHTNEEMVLIHGVPVGIKTIEYYHTDPNMEVQTIDRQICRYVKLTHQMFSGLIVLEQDEAYRLLYIGHNNYTLSAFPIIPMHGFDIEDWCSNATLNTLHGRVYKATSKVKYGDAAVLCVFTNGESSIKDTVTITEDQLLLNLRYNANGPKSKVSSREEAISKLAELLIGDTADDASVTAPKAEDEKRMNLLEGRVDGLLNLRINQRLKSLEESRNLEGDKYEELLKKFNKVTDVLTRLLEGDA